MTTATDRSAPTTRAVDALAVSTLKFLAADMVDAANSGHPGMPMGAAPMAWTLWSRHLKHDPADSAWPDRDRFVLSAGHGSALLYGLLHMFGYDVTTDDLRAFRQLGSRTPGHPEFGHTDGVETTTGPLGQGLAMAVGLALAERMQAARYPEITDHHTYAIVGDGCLMEGVSHEAASLAGTLGLGRLIVLWDDNGITIDGPVSQSSTDDQAVRFQSYGWQVLTVDDGTDIEAIDAAIGQAKADERPTLIAVRTIIGAGAPGVEGTSAAHGSPLGPDRLRAAKELAQWTYPDFTVPDEVAQRCQALADDGAETRAMWSQRAQEFQTDRPEAAAQWQRAWERNLPEDLWDLLDELPDQAAEATRESSRKALTALAGRLDELVGGSADLASSTGTSVGRSVVTADDYSGGTINFGIREFGMAALLNGLSLHGGFRAYGSTFLVFSDYLRPALRLSALMNQPVIYILTHDSVAVGEDGPTHQPVEHVESLRLIPGVTVLRPADALETRWAWRSALLNTTGPTVLVLSRQALPALPARDASTALDALDETGSRVVLAADTPDLDLVASGSEVSLALAAAERLAAEGIDARVTSVPWRERWSANRPHTACPVLSVEAGSTVGWRSEVDVAVGIETFGLSGPGNAAMAHFGLTPDALAEVAHTLVTSGDTPC